MKSPSLSSRRSRLTATSGGGRKKVGHTVWRWGEEIHHAARNPLSMRRPQRASAFVRVPPGGSAGSFLITPLCVPQPTQAASESVRWGRGSKSRAGPSGWWSVRFPAVRCLVGDNGEQLEAIADAGRGRRPPLVRAAVPGSRLPGTANRRTSPAPKRRARRGRGGA